MYNKLLVLVASSVVAASAVAVDNSEFQAFDNQVSIGFGQNQTTSQDKSNTNFLNIQNNVDLNAERLFNNGVWVNLDANMDFGASNPALASTGVASSNYGLNGKVGYAFPLLNQHLQLIPYALLGVNNNGEAGDVFTPKNEQSYWSANQFFYTFGAGGRLEYRINSVFMLYVDQLAAYNVDQTGYTNGVNGQSNYQYTTTLGAKFNIVDDLQLGVAGFYNAYQNIGSINDYMLQGVSGVGGMVSIGMTY